MQPKGANRVVIDAFSQQSDIDDLDTFASLLSDQYAENLQNYLDPQSHKCSGFILFKYNALQEQLYKRGEVPV